MEGHDHLSHSESPNGSGSRDTARVRVLTLNVWGIKHIAKQHTERLRAIAEHIVHPPPTSSTSSTASSPPSPDIVALQELFTHADYVLLRRLTRPVLPHGAFYHNGAFGAGLVILSRWRIEESRMEGFVLNGRPSAFWRGDWYVGKGVACARVRLPCSGGSGGSGGSGYLQVFNTHLHAPYNEGAYRDGSRRDSYACHRACQAWQIGGMMRRAMERGDVVVGCGDFNMVVSGLEYRVIQHRGRDRLTDVWRHLHPESSVGAWDDMAQESPPPTVADSLQLHGHTCDSVLNTWRWSKSHQKQLLRHGRDRVVDADGPDPKAKRLDYIFLGDGTTTGTGTGTNTETDIATSGLSGWNVISARVSMTQRHPTLNCSLSDHFAVEAEIAWSRSRSLPLSPPKPSAPQEPRAEKAEAEENNTNILENTLDNTLNPLITLISSYTTTTVHHRRLRLLHFLLSLLLSLACHIAVWFVPAPAAFALMLFSTLNLAAGVVDGLIGLLSCGAELRGLKMVEGEVEREMERERERVSQIGKLVGVDGSGAGSQDGEVEAEGEEDIEVVLARERVMDWWS